MNTQKMQNWIVKSKPIFVGLEDSKKTWKLSVRSEKMEVHYTSMPAKYDHLYKYLSKRYPGCKITVIYEAGFRGFWLHDLLEADGIRCVVTPPTRVVHERRRRVKNDKVDARRLAVILENGDYKRCFVPDQELRKDRQISRTLVAVQKDITRNCSRIKMMLYFHGIQHGLPGKEWSEEQYRSLRHLEGLGDSLRYSLDMMLDILEMLFERAKELKRRVKALGRKPRYARVFDLLGSVPGIGELTAIRLILEWGEDWSRFGSSKKISRFSGLTASEASTGERDHKGRITGESAGFVRSWLIQCAWTAIRKDPVLLSKFQCVWRNSGSKKKAIVAVARKLVVRMRAILIADIPYVLGVVE